MFRYDASDGKIREKTLQIIDKDLNVIAPLYLEVIQGRFTRSVGRVVKVEREINKTSPNRRDYDKYSVFLMFEPGGKSYKFEASDYRDSKLFWRRDYTSDAHLNRVDENDNKKIPKLTDRYGTPVTVGLMMVVHTHQGLKIGTVKSITPKGSIRFKDFDNSKLEFTKQLWVGGGDSSEIMALQKDFMDQMLLRKLARV